EGDSATITVTRSGNSSGSVSVNYAARNGTARAGSDYSPASGMLNFGAGDMSKTFTVQIFDDNLAEPEETVNLELTAPSGGAILGSQTTAVLTIIDNELKGNIGGFSPMSGGIGTSVSIIGA